MKLRPLRVVALVLIVQAGGGCVGTGTPSVTPTPAAATYAEADAAVCSAFTALIVAVGNPDTAAPSVLSKSLDDAVAAGDVTGADRAAASIKSELETGRQQAASAGRWQPAQPFAVAMDKLLVAFEAQITAKQAAARHTPGAVDPQTALEQAGGPNAWTAMLQAVSTMPVPSGASPQPCKAFSGTP